MRQLTHDRARRGTRPPARRAVHTLTLAAGAVVAVAGFVVVLVQPVVLASSNVTAMWAGFGLIALGGATATNAVLSLAQVS